MCSEKPTKRAYLNELSRGSELGLELPMVDRPLYLVVVRSINTGIESNSASIDSTKLSKLLREDNGARKRWEACRSAEIAYDVLSSCGGYSKTQGILHDQQSHIGILTDETPVRASVVTFRLFEGFEGVSLSLRSGSTVPGGKALSPYAEQKIRYGENTPSVPENIVGIAEYVRKHIH